MKSKYVKILVGLMTVAMLALVGCEVTKTESVTDENGNTTTTTTTTENGKTTTTTETTSADDDMEGYELVDQVTADLAVLNSTDSVFTGIYLTRSDYDEWGDNIIDGDTLATDEMITMEGGISYTPGYSWDAEVETDAGETLDVAGLDFSSCDNPESVTIEFYTADDGSLAADVY